MSRTVFIFGAGASAEAGAPLMWNFLNIAENVAREHPQDADHESFDLVAKARAALDVVHAKARLNTNNIEDLFAAFEMMDLLEIRPGGLTDMEIRSLPSAIRRLIVRTLEQKIRFPLAQSGAPQQISEWEILPPIPYGRFADSMRDSFVRKATDVAYITFNYDVALDFALLKSGRAPNYCWKDPTAASGPPLMKLHGSLNWAYCHACKTLIPCSLLEYVKRARPFMDIDSSTQHVCFPISTAINDRHEVCGTAFDQVPVIVPPTWNKGPYQEILAPVWRAAARHLSEAENIFIIGYSMPETDQFFRYLFALGTLGAARIRRVVVIDPDESGQVKRRFQEILGGVSRDCFFYKETKFSNAISYIPGNLS